MYLKIDESLPETILYDKNTDLTKLKYPIVFKPDNGQVSYMVEVINSKEEAIKSRFLFIAIDHGTHRAKRFLTSLGIKIRVIRR